MTLEADKRGINMEETLEPCYEMVYVSQPLTVSRRVLRVSAMEAASSLRP
jgi:hypothetical protein